MIENLALVRDDTLINIMRVDSDDPIDLGDGVELIPLADLPANAGIGSTRDGETWSDPPPPIPQWPLPQMLFLDGRGFWVENGRIVRELTQDEIDMLEQSAA